MRRPQRSRHGVSLVEALLAVAVMGIGMLAYVGLQGSLRLNGDVARQRSEAVRLAQVAIESWRAYRAIETTAGETDYEEIATVAAEAVAASTTNTTYTLSRTVVDAAVGPAAPRIKTLVVDVGWPDRHGDAQSLRLSTAIAATPPELAGTLSVPGAGGPLRRPQGRHPFIPVEAVHEGSTSRFVPPQPEGGTLSWVFDNLTGLITQVCTPASECTATSAFLLSGFVRYAVTETPPTPAQAEHPPSPVTPAVQVVVQRTAPSAMVVQCFEQLRASDLRYFCAVPVDATGPDALRWSGRSLLAGLPLAVSAADANAGDYKVCRYTTARHHDPLPNAQHPLDYVDVAGPLTNQNFLVIRAGFGGTAFGCPDDDPATVFVDGTSWHHQPSH
jgi:Tfp pilus assembly protein PilV